VIEIFLNQLLDVSLDHCELRATCIIVLHLAIPIAQELAIVLADVNCTRHRRIEQSGVALEVHEQWRHLFAIDVDLETE
jgi:hypothetical protein